MIRSVVRKTALKVPAIARLVARIHALDQHVLSLLAERDAAITQRNGLVAERDEALQRQSIAAAERDAAVAQRNGLAVERDQALKHQSVVAAERDAAIMQRNGLVIERDESLQHRATATAERDAAIIQRNGLVIERDEALQHRAVVAKDLARIEGEKNRIVMTVFGAGQIDRDYIAYNYWAAHPRYIFFKSLPRNAKMLDIGAGSGGTAIWRGWGNPYRHDIRLFGFDLPPDKNNHAWERTYADLYEKWQFGDLETAPLDFDDDFFDGAMATNVLEHVNRPWNVLKSLFGKLKPGARCYIELPTVASKDLPTAHELAARGMPVMVANFYDDNTHVEAYPLKAIADVARSIGFVVDGGGVVRQPFLEETIWQYGLDHNDSEMLLYGYWSITGWIQYLILRRPHEDRTWEGTVRQLVGDRSSGADLWA